MVTMVTRNVKAKRYVNVLGKMDASSQQLRGREGERERAILGLKNAQKY